MADLNIVFVLYVRRWCVCVSLSEPLCFGTDYTPVLSIAIWVCRGQHFWLLVLRCIRHLWAYQFWSLLTNCQGQYQFYLFPNAYILTSLRLQQLGTVTSWHGRLSRCLHIANILIYLSSKLLWKVALRCIYEQQAHEFQFAAASSWSVCVAVHLKQCVCSGNSSSSAAPVVNKVSLFVDELKGSAEEVICYICYKYMCLPNWLLTTSRIQGFVTLCQSMHISR